MICIRQNGEERQISYEEFIKEIREGRVDPEAEIQSEALTSGAWKPAGKLRLFRAWAPKEMLPQEPEEPDAPPEAVEEPPPPEPEPPEPAEPPWEPDEEEDRFPPLSDEPPEPVEAEEPSLDDLIPWEQTKQIGTAVGIYGTFWLAFRNVPEFFRRIARGQSLVPALLFGLTVSAVWAVFDAIYGYVFVTTFSETIEEMRTQLPGVFSDEMFASPRELVSSSLMRLVFIPAMVFLWSGIAHLLLRAFNQPVGPFYLSFRVVSYSLAPLILSAIPLCGYIVGWVWAVVLACRGLAQVHRASGGAAALAAILPFIVPLCLTVSGVLQSMTQVVSSTGGGF